MDDKNLYLVKYTNAYNDDILEIMELSKSNYELLQYISNHQYICIKLTDDIIDFLNFFKHNNIKLRYIIDGYTENFFDEEGKLDIVRFE